MSDMDYGKAWGKLKRIVMELEESSINISERDSENLLVRHRAYGGKLLAERILDEMDSMEKEMTTDSEDDERLQEVESEMEGC